MQAVLLAILLAISPTIAVADVSAKAFAHAKKEALTIVFSFEEFQIKNAIISIAESDKLVKADLTKDKLNTLGHAVAVAHELSGVDWRIILSVMYVESRLCHKDWLKGDKHLENYRSIGCMQVHTSWWGKKLKAAGIAKTDLLDYDIGIVIGSLILADRIDRYGFDEGIRRYNGTGPAAEAYRKKVMKAYRLTEPWLDIW
jgi:hypothetical protein